MYKQGGIEKLFTGMRAKLLQTVLTAAFTFLTYEQILGAVQSTLIKQGR
jgi:adenine nucleotide transporter 17